MIHLEKDVAQLLSECRECIASGESIEKVISYLHNDHVSLLDSMKIIRTLYDMSLGEAKKIVLEHPAWANVDRTAETIFLQVLALGPDSTYGDWLEVYFYGFPRISSWFMTIKRREIA